MTGMREQEVMHTYWSDVNLKASTVKVTHKTDLGWTPKAYKERETRTKDLKNERRQCLRAHTRQTLG
jgi:hypothetical protein